MPDVAIPPLDDHLVHVPVELRGRFREIVALTDRFCADHLNNELLVVCRTLTADIFRHEAPLERGKVESWACAIVHNIAQVNLLLNPTADNHITAEQIHRAFGVSAGTMYKWSNEIREGLQIDRLDKRFIATSVQCAALTVKELAELLTMNPKALSAPETIVTGIVSSRTGFLSDIRVEVPEELPPPRRDLAFELRITLLGADPSVWRRVQVPDCTLEDLHEVIQVAMGWEDSHMHEFQVKKHRYSPEPPEGMPDYLMDDDDASYTCDVLLSEIVPERSRRFRFHYVYDFGDNWEHEIAVEKKLKGTEAEALSRPVCLEGAMACPPDDIGGVFGYEDLLQALDEPQSNWHHELAEMFEGFRPDEFDMKRVNRELTALWRV